MFAIPVVVSAAVVGGLYRLYRNKQNEAQQNTAMQKGFDTIKIYYPECHQKIVAIYETLGLIPLILKGLESAEYGEELTTINKVIQEILSPEGLELNDTTYLNLIQTRLNQAYAKENLYTQTINISMLKLYFSSPLAWDTPMPDEKVDATKIIQARNNLNTYIKTYPGFKDPACILKYLDGLAKEFNELTQTFQGRCFVNIKLGIAPIELTPPERRRLTGT